MFCLIGNIEKIASKALQLCDAGCTVHLDNVIASAPRCFADTNHFYLTTSTLDPHFFSLPLDAILTQRNADRLMIVGRDFVTFYVDDSAHVLASDYRKTHGFVVIAHSEAPLDYLPSDKDMPGSDIDAAQLGDLVEQLGLPVVDKVVMRRDLALTVTHTDGFFRIKKQLVTRTG